MLWSLALGALTGFVFRLIFSGHPNQLFNVMMAAFTVFVPVAIAVVTVYVAERYHRRSWAFYFWAPAAANMFFVIGTFLVYIEGLICTILAVPLFSMIGGLAGLVTGAVMRRSARAGGKMLSVVALPLLLGSVEQHLPLPERIDTVSAARTIPVSPELVWQAITVAEDIRPDEMGSAWMYRIGVPSPVSAVVEENNGERVRHVRMGKGIEFDQVIVDWEPARHMRFTYRFTPESFPPRALDEHVLIGGEYFDLIDTEYRLEPIDGGTRLSVRMSYRVSTHFNWYARLVAWLLVSNFEETALGFFADRAET